MAALGLGGCGNQSHPAATGPSLVTTTIGAAPPTPPASDLPPPDALTAVLGRLADPAVSGADKVALVEYATADEADDLNKFSQALQDSGLLPVTFDATELTWSQSNPGNVSARVGVHSANREGESFSFPMEFSPTRDGWRLTRGTAELLLTLEQPSTTTPTR